MPADSPGDRKQLLVGRVVEARRNGAPVTFEAEGVEIVYGDRRIALDAPPAARDRLESLLSEYRVVKIDQPETRKADGDAVYLSAVTDAKRVADFVESLFREVYEFDEGYTLEASTAE
jgi:hypothetical protein